MSWMTYPDLLWWDNGTAINLPYTVLEGRTWIWHFFGKCHFSCWTGHPGRVSGGPGLSEQVLLGWLVRSLHSLISELIEMKTHRQQ